MEDQDRIQELIKTGEAVDEQEAREVIYEADHAMFLRLIDRGGYIRTLDSILQDPGAEPFDRYDANYRKAVVETGQTPDEFEYLWYQMLLDIEATARPQEESARRRKENTTARLERKAGGLASRIGEARAHELFEQYRQKLQELMDSY